MVTGEEEARELTQQRAGKVGLFTPQDLLQGLTHGLQTTIFRERGGLWGHCSRKPSRWGSWW